LNESLVSRVRLAAERPHYALSLSLASASFRGDASLQPHPWPLAVGELATESLTLIAIPVIAVMVIAVMVIAVMVIGVIVAVMVIMVPVIVSRSRGRRDCAEQHA
jgi:hypothetical protein